jgi:hypothetical protein
MELLVEDGSKVPGAVKNPKDVDSTFGWSVEDQVLVESPDRERTEIGKVAPVEYPSRTELGMLHEHTQRRLDRIEEAKCGVEIVTSYVYG